MSPVAVIIDFETRSRLDLGSTNNYKYARHSSTETICMSYKIGDEPIQVWRPGEPFPFAHVWPNVTFPAFNGEFELCIWKYVCTPKYGWPEIDPTQIDCLQARSAYAGWPRNLEDACNALGMGSMGKDTEGGKNMLRLCKPVRVKGNPVKQVGCEYFGGHFDDNPTKHKRNEVYCSNDVAAETMVHRMAPALPAAETELWRTHQRINERGVPVDVDLCRNATLLVEREKKRLCRELLELTDWMVRTPNCLERFKEWLKRQNFSLPCMDEEAVGCAVAGGMGDVPPKVRLALTIRLLYHNAAVSKYQAIIDHAESDGRCRAAHVFYKAGPGRFAGVGVNFLNLVRMNEHEAPRYHELADRISAADEAHLDDLYTELRATEKIDDRGVVTGGVVPTLGAMVRAAVCAGPGNKLVDVDFKSIEYRKLHWLAGDEREISRIRDFDDGVGLEPYVLAAASIFNKKADDVTKAERQIGKVQRLGAGYMAGAQTFAAFCATYGIDMPLDKANEIVQHYRRENPMVKKFWYNAGRAAVKAVKTGKQVALRHVEFCVSGCTLNVKLPSGRCMKYYDAQVVDGLYGPEIAALDQRTGGVKAVGLPILIENIDQGSSRDLLAGALVKSDSAKLPVVLHVYDSIMMEVPEDDDDSQVALTSLMCLSPTWCPDLPVSCDVKVSKRMT